jgi:hypothetical protein
MYIYVHRDVYIHRYKGKSIINPRINDMLNSSNERNLNPSCHGLTVHPHKHLYLTPNL